MTIIDNLINLTGSWQATYRLWMAPDSDAQESSSRAIVSPMVNGKMACIEYTWTVEGILVEGELFIGYENQSQQVTVVWVDSWHNGERFMICQGEVRPDGALSVLGEYPPPYGPDWTWRTVIAVNEAGFSLRMYNIPPGGPELLAVEAVYRRAD